MMVSLSQQLFRGKEAFPLRKEQDNKDCKFVGINKTLVVEIDKTAKNFLEVFVQNCMEKDNLSLPDKSEKGRNMRG